MTFAVRLIRIMYDEWFHGVAESLCNVTSFSLFMIRINILRYVSGTSADVIGILW